MEQVAHNQDLEAANKSASQAQRVERLGRLLEALQLTASKSLAARDHGNAQKLSSRVLFL